MAKKSADKKTATTTRKRRTKAGAPGAAAASDGTPGAGHNSERASRLAIEQERALFLTHRSAWASYRAKIDIAEKFGDDVKAALKSDGFTVKQFQIADQLGKPKGEARVIGEITDRLKVARWLGHPAGKQLDMFEEPDRTPIVDRARDQGKMASMENRAARPQDAGYSPDTEAFRAYMDGFHQHQGEIAGAGLRKPGEGVTSGEPLTRSEFNQRLKEQTAIGDAIATGGEEEWPADDVVQH